MVKKVNNHTFCTSHNVAAQNESFAHAHWVDRLPLRYAR